MERSKKAYSSRQSDGKTANVRERAAAPSAAALGVAFLLAVVFGAQTEAWSWGPGLLILGFAAILVMVNSRVCFRLGAVGVTLILAIVWIVGRAIQSPVLDAARADILLAIGLVSCSWITYCLAPDGKAMCWLHVGLASTALANLALALVQIQQPELVWPYASKPSPNPTGFFGHYNYFANFVGGVGLLCLCRASFVKSCLWMRTLYVLPFLGAVIMVPLSGSRGGTVSLAAGSSLFLVAAGILAWRNRSAWSSAFLVVLPIVLVASTLGSWMVLKNVDDRRSQVRGPGGGLSIVDNLARLQWLELASEVTTEHPLVGGGSRAFSWERNQKWDVDTMGRGGENEPFVHNELVQTITDYGLVGAFLVLSTLGCMMWIAVKQLFLGGSGDDGGQDATAAAILAAGGMLLLQSNFSFVFHLLPSTMLLGVLLGLAMYLEGDGRGARHQEARWKSAGMLVIALPLLAAGVVGSITLIRVWPVIYGNPKMATLGADEQMKRLSSAAKCWPGYRLAEERGRVARLEAVSFPPGSVEQKVWNGRAAEQYESASEFHPYHPGFQVNRANILSDLGMVNQAEAAFDRAIELQGGLESGFRARLCFAQHLYRRWYRIWQEERRSGEALHEFLRARDLLNQSDTQSLYGFEDSKALRRSLDHVIRFLEGGKVSPLAPTSPSTQE